MVVNKIAVIKRMRALSAEKERVEQAKWPGSRSDAKCPARTCQHFTALAELRESRAIQVLLGANKMEVVILHACIMPAACILAIMGSPPDFLVP